LKPSKAVTAIDAQMYAIVFGKEHGPDGEVWTTHSNISKNIFGIIFAADIKSNYFMTTNNVGFNVSVNFDYSLSFHFDDL
jgi:hypothetical protein